MKWPTSLLFMSTYLCWTTAAARPAIQLVQVPFDGELAVDNSGRWVRHVVPNVPQYVGPPSDAIDHAWKDLIARKKPLFWLESKLR